MAASVPCRTLSPGQENLAVSLYVIYNFILQCIMHPQEILVLCTVYHSYIHRTSWGLFHCISCMRSQETLVLFHSVSCIHRKCFIGHRVCVFTGGPGSVLLYIVHTRKALYQLSNTPSSSIDCLKTSKQISKPCWRLMNLFILSHFSKCGNHQKKSIKRERGMTKELTGNAIPPTKPFCSYKEHGLRSQRQVKSNSSLL